MLDRIADNRSRLVAYEIGHEELSRHKFQSEIVGRGAERSRSRSRERFVEPRLPHGGRPRGLYEYRIIVDVDSFPSDFNVIGQILGPKGKYQQRMKAESDAVVTMIGRGVRNASNPDDPMTILVKSKVSGHCLTRRQVAVVQAIYDEIISLIKQFGHSDGLGHVDIPNSGPPESLVEFLWYLHQLLIIPRDNEVTVNNLFSIFKEHYGYDCPLGRWLIIDDSGVIGALSRIPHVVDLYRSLATGNEDIICLRSSNSPDITFVAFRELDDAYKAKLMELNRPTSGGSTFLEEKHSSMVTVVQAIHRLLLEKAHQSNNGSVSVEMLPHDFLEMYKSTLDVFELFQEPSLLSFLQKFPTIYQIYFDGSCWRVQSLGENVDVDRSVHVALLSRKPRIAIKIAHLIPRPVNSIDHHQQSISTKSGKNSDKQVKSLVQILQNLQQKNAAVSSNKNISVSLNSKKSKDVQSSGTSEPSSSVITDQIQALLKKKKEKESNSVSSSALNDLLKSIKKA